MSALGRHRVFVRMFSSAVVDQAALSAASLAVSLLLIRHTADEQYGYYVLIVTGLLLLTSLQNSFYSPSLIVRMSRYDLAARQDLVGGIYREGRRIWGGVIALAAVFVVTLWLGGALRTSTALLVLAAVVVALTSVNREFFRTVLLAHRQSHVVLKADLFYVVLLVIGAGLATLTPAPAIAAVVTLGLATVVGGRLLNRALRRFEDWNPQGAHGILREIAPLAIWSTAGAVIHWSFSQGYSYLVAGTLDISAVAAIAATRLLMMPVNLLSTGIGSLMLPLTAGWLQQHGVAIVLRRLLLFALGVAAVAACYLALMWLLRDWLFVTLLKKQFPHRDRLLLLWSAISMLMVVRDQLQYLPIARERFRQLAPLSLLSAVSSLSVSYWAMLHYGVTGALIGVLVGEVVNVIGLVVLSLIEIDRPVAAAPQAVSG